MRDIIQMACGECKRRNYSTTKNKKKTTERLEMKKYCRSAGSTNRTRSRSSPRLRGRATRHVGQ